MTYTPTMTDTATLSPKYVCGDLLKNPNEQCDFGKVKPWLNCCTTFCRFKNAGSACGQRQGECFKAPRCSKSHVCMPGLPRPSQSSCKLSGTIGRCVNGQCMPSKHR